MKGIFVFVVASLLPVSANAAENIIQKNKDYVDSVLLNMECSQGINTVHLNLFAKKGTLFMYRDSNSSIGTAIAVYKPTDEDVSKNGIRYEDYNVNRINDVFVSKETIEKGKGEITAIIFSEPYNCDVSLDK